VSFLLTTTNLAELQKKLDELTPDDQRLLLFECNRFVSDYVREELTTKHGWDEDHVAILEQLIEKAARQAVLGW
jgi:hypothetical protein